MKQRIVGTTLFLAALACSGMTGPDPAGIALLDAALADSHPETAVDLLIQGSIEAGSVRPDCAAALHAFQNGDPSMRARSIVAALSDRKAKCPATCMGSVEPLAPLSPEERIAKALELCDAAGPDPVFGGPLAPLRTSMSPFEYLVVRKLTEIADAASPTFFAHHPKLAVGLALKGMPLLTPTAELVAVPPLDPAASSALTAAIPTCGPEAALAHRVVVDPRGKVAGVAGPSEPCVVAALEGLAVPASGAWTVVDLAWKPEPPAAPRAPVQ